MAPGFRIAVIGASTLVGGEIVRILEERDFPVQDLLLLETKGSLGKPVQFRDQDLPARSLGHGCFKGVAISFFAAGARVSMEYADAARGNGSVVIDTTSAHRLDRDVPLVVPEVNAGRIAGHGGIIASPAAGAIQLALVLSPIHRRAGIRRVVLSAFQAVSDTGEAGMDELTEQITELFNFREPRCSVFPHQIAFNALPQVGAFLDNAYTAEEMDIAAETGKILEDDGIRVCATMAHIPVFFSSSQSLNIETSKKMTPDQVRKLLKGSPGVIVEDDPAGGVYPLDVYAAGKDDCFAGRIREDVSTDNGIAMWTAMDNIRKGAALNAVQIAEHVISRAHR